MKRRRDPKRKLRNLEIAVHYLTLSVTERQQLKDQIRDRLPPRRWIVYGKEI